MPKAGAIAVLAALLTAREAHAWGLSFKPLARGELWPRVELRRDANDAKDAKDAKGAKGVIDARVFLHQVTNPARTFGPYLNEKQVGALVFPARAGASVIALDPAMRVPMSSLVPGRYELRVRAEDAEGKLLAEAVGIVDEVRVAELTAMQARSSRASIAAANETDSAQSPAPHLDPMVARLDARELSTLPSDDARKTAQVFAVVLAARDAESFRQLVAQGGLKTDKGTVPHAELEKQLSKGIDAFVGPAPRAAWHVQYTRDTPDRFTMRPSATATEHVAFQKSADGRWRIDRVGRKKPVDE